MNRLLTLLEERCLVGPDPILCGYEEELCREIIRGVDNPGIYDWLEWRDLTDEEYDRKWEEMKSDERNPNHNP